MKKLCTCPKCGKAIDITDHNLIDTIPCMSCAEEFEPFEVKDVRQEEEVQKLCATCRKGDNNADERCPDRGACFTPNYDSWEPIGSETEDTGCETCSHWAAVKIGKFCPDCAQALR